jgi:integrin beta 3
LGSIAPPSVGLAEALGSIAGPNAPVEEATADESPAPRNPNPFDVDEDHDEDHEGLSDLDGRNRDNGIEVTIDPLFSGTREIRTNRRAELKREFNEVRRVRTATVILLVMAILGAPLTFYAIREAAADPVFNHLGALEVPDWAARDPQDEASGSRWCIGECRLRQRILRSEKSPEETNAVYATALRKAGWTPWKIAGCPPEGQEGFESCWQRDEYVLDLWVYQPECEVQLKPTDPGQPANTVAEAVCPPTVVTLKIINKVSFESGNGSGS